MQRMHIQGKVAGGGQVVGDECSTDLTTRIVTTDDMRSAERAFGWAVLKVARAGVRA